MRRVNKAGIQLIKSFEGFSSKPYPDPGTGAEPITIGYGNTYYENKTKVTMHDSPISEERAHQLLEFEVDEKAKSVESLLKVSVNDNEFAALVSFAYNCGVANLSGSTLLKLLNANADRTAVADQFLRWDKAAGKVMAGLTRRRQAERSLFLQPVVESTSEQLPSGPSEEDINDKLNELENEIMKK
jgi:lysozyme